MIQTICRLARATHGITPHYNKQESAHRGDRCAGYRQNRCLKMKTWHGLTTKFVLVCFLLCGASNLYALDSDEEDKLLTPDDNLVAYVLAEEKANK